MIFGAILTLLPVAIAVYVIRWALKNDTASKDLSLIGPPNSAERWNHIEEVQRQRLLVSQADPHVRTDWR